MVVDVELGLDGNAIDRLVIECFALAARAGALLGGSGGGSRGFFGFGTGFRASASRNVGLLATGVPGTACDRAVIEMDHVA